MNKKILIFVLFLLVLTLSSNEVKASPIEENLTLRLQVTNASSYIIQDTQFLLQFNISDANGIVLYTNTTSGTTDKRGIIIVNLTNVNIDYSQLLFLFYYRYNILDNSLMKSESIRIPPNPYSLFAKNLSYNTITSRHILPNQINQTHLTQSVYTNLSGQYAPFNGTVFSNVANLTYVRLIDANSTFVNWASGNNTYVKLSDANNTYVRLDFINSTYRTLDNFTFSSNLTTKSIVPDSNNTAFLGNASNYWNSIWVNAINLITKITYSQLNLANSILGIDIQARQINETHLTQSVFNNLTNNPTLNNLTNIGQLTFNTTLPRVQSCGGAIAKFSQITGNDNIGNFTNPSNTAKGCNITFSNEWLNPPSCSVNQFNASSNLYWETNTTTLIIQSPNQFTNRSITWQCLGRLN